MKLRPRPRDPYEGSRCAGNILSKTEWTCVLGPSFPSRLNFGFRDDPKLTKLQYPNDVELICGGTAEDFPVYAFAQQMNQVLFTFGQEWSSKVPTLNTWKWRNSNNHKHRPGGRLRSSQRVQCLALRSQCREWQMGRVG